MLLVAQLLNAMDYQKLVQLHALHQGIIVLDIWVDLLQVFINLKTFFKGMELKVIDVPEMKYYSTHMRDNIPVP